MLRVTCFNWQHTCPQTYISWDSKEDLVHKFMQPQLGITLSTARNQQLRISLNPLISIRSIHWAGLFYIMTKKSSTNCSRSQGGRMDMKKTAACDSLHDISSDASPQSSSRSQVQARGMHRPFLQANWSAWQGWAEKDERSHMIKKKNKKHNACKEGAAGYAKHL